MEQISNLLGDAELLRFAAMLVGAGIVAGVLAGLFGIGGGAVLVPVFYQFFSLSDVDPAIRMHMAVGTSLAIIVPTSLRSFFAHRSRRAVDETLLRQFVLAVPLGVVLAALTTAQISSQGLRAIFAAITVIVALKLLFARASWRLGAEIPANPGRFFVGSIIGYFSTLMGIGGGVMNNTFMTLYNRPIHQAVATSAGVGVLISIPGALGYVWAGWGQDTLPPLSTGYVNWLAVLLIIPLTLVTAPVGVRLAHAWPKRQLEVLFGLFLLAVAVRFGVSLL